MGEKIEMGWITKILSYLLDYQNILPMLEVANRCLS